MTSANTPDDIVSQMEVVVYYPKYYWLMEHGRKHTVIRVPTKQDELEIERMMQAAQEQCEHVGELGDCIEIVPASFEEWLETHPGD